MAQKSFGTVLQIDDGGFATIGEILSVNPGGLTSSTIDTTHMETAGGYRTFISDTFKDPGECTITLQYDPTDITTMYGYVGSTYDFKVVYPDAGATEESFSGVVTGFVQNEATMEGKLEGSMTIKRSGAPTLST